jgi:hypothetical protein
MPTPRRGCKAAIGSVRMNQSFLEFYQFAQLDMPNPPLGMQGCHRFIPNESNFLEFYQFAQFDMPNPSLGIVHRNILVFDYRLVRSLSKLTLIRQILNHPSRFPRTPKDSHITFFQKMP